MGMFDNVRCYYPLPQPRYQGRDFQTKSYINYLTNLAISEDGLLMEMGDLDKRFQEISFTGTIVFYDSDEFIPGIREWVEYEAKFKDGRIIPPIVRHENTVTFLQDE